MCAQILWATAVTLIHYSWSHLLQVWADSSSTCVVTLVALHSEPLNGGMRKRIKPRTLRQCSYQWSCSSRKDTEIGTLEWARLRLSAGSTGLYITPGTGTSEQKLTCRLSPMEMQQEERESSTSWPGNWVGHTETSSKVFLALTLSERALNIYSIFAFTPDEVYESFDQCTKIVRLHKTENYLCYIS